MGDMDLTVIEPNEVDKLYALIKLAQCETVTKGIAGLNEDSLDSIWSNEEMQMIKSKMLGIVEKV